MIPAVCGTRSHCDVIDLRTVPDAHLIFALFADFTALKSVDE